MMLKVEICYLVRSTDSTSSPPPSSLSFLPSLPPSFPAFPQMWPLLPLFPPCAKKQLVANLHFNHGNGSCFCQAEAVVVVVVVAVVGPPQDAIMTMPRGLGRTAGEGSRSGTTTTTTAATRAASKRRGHAEADPSRSMPLCLRPRRSSHSPSASLLRGVDGVRAGVLFAVAVLAWFGQGTEAVSSGGYHSCSVFDDGTVKVRLIIKLPWFEVLGALLF